MVEQRTSQTVTSALANLQERMTGMRRLNGFRDPSVCEVQSRITDEDTGRGYGQAEHELRLVVGVRFCANAAQYPDARRNAERTLMHELYRDVLYRLSGIRHSVFDGDQRGALQRILELEQELTR